MLKFFAEKMWVAFALYIESAKIVNEIALNELVKLTTLWTTGPWLVSFNPTKTEAMLFSLKLNRPHHPPIFMQNHQITEVDSHKHLGLYLSNDCTWHKHINYITEKAWTRISLDA